MILFTTDAGLCVTGRDDDFEILHKALFHISHGVAEKFWNGGGSNLSCG
jgi:hypothetical protein